jgi:NarL family two-component system sensor histidine kinase YdfH
MKKNFLVEYLKNPFYSPSREGKAVFKELAPFLVLITMAFGWMYYQSWLLIAGQPKFYLYSTLFFIHFFLYLSIIYFSTTQERKLVYIALQGGLAFTLVWVGGDIFMVIGIYAALIGAVVGLFGRDRMALVSTVFFLSLAALNIVLLRGIESILPIVPMLLPTVLFSAIFAYMFSRQTAARYEIMKANEKLSQYALEVEKLTLAAERQRMARDLHDTLAQGLAGLILQLEAANAHFEQGNLDKTQAIIEQAMGRARLTLADARKAIDDLRTTGSRSLDESIAEEVQRFESATGIPCELKLDLPDAIDEALTEHVYRSVSEGLSNITRHAQASQVSIHLQLEADALQVEIADDGIGFDPQTALNQPGHYGLLGLRERVRLAGGTFSINSQPGQGATLSISYPLSKGVPAHA